MSAIIRSNLEDFQFLYGINKIERNTPNEYLTQKSMLPKRMCRKETDGEHVLSCIRLTDMIFLSHADVLRQYNQNRIKVLLTYHDDPEIIDGDFCISDEDMKKNLSSPLERLDELLSKYPVSMRAFVGAAIKEFELGETGDSIFAHAIDKFEPINLCLGYGFAWGKSKKFSEEDTRRRSEPTISKVSIIHDYFEEAMSIIRKNGWFDQ